MRVCNQFAGCRNKALVASVFLRRIPKDESNGLLEGRFEEWGNLISNDE